MRQPLPTSQKNLTVACWKVWFTDAHATSLNPTRGTTQWSFQVYRLDRKKPWIMHDSARTLKQFHCGFQFKVWFFGLLCSCSAWCGVQAYLSVPRWSQCSNGSSLDWRNPRSSGARVGQSCREYLDVWNYVALSAWSPKKAEQRTGWIQFVFDLIPCLQRDDLPIPRVQFYLFTKLFW